MTNPVVALIPARGGSRGIPRKNLARVHGHTLLEWAVWAAQEARGVHRVVVSSDDPEILGLALTLGAEALRRPEWAARDEATASDVVRHFAEAWEATAPGGDPTLVYLQPTSPLRTARHVDGALELLSRSGARSVVSVVPMEPSPFKAFRLDGAGRLEPLLGPEGLHANRQDLPQVYVQNGAVYAFPLSEFRARGAFPTAGAAPFLMSPEDSLDVDTPQDLDRAEAGFGRDRADGFPMVRAS